MTRRRLRRGGIVLSALILIVAAFVLAALRDAAPTSAGFTAGEAAPALAAKFGRTALPAQMGVREGERTYEDELWMRHALPGSTIPNSVIANSSEDWDEMRSRDAGSGKWRPLGPTWAKGLPNMYRDRSVYNANTRDFSGRIAHGVIDPNCGSRGDDDDDDDGGSCRLWIANANGGVWRTDNALAKEPEWKYLSQKFEHNNIGGLELDPNDKRANTIWAGTGEGNGCSSGCEAGVGVYKSTNGGDSWSGPYGQEAFYNRSVASLQVKPGDSKTIFAASTRAGRGLSNTCCRGVDHLIPGAPHFGLWRSKDGGKNWQLVHQGANVLCTATPADTVSVNQSPCSPRGARRVHIDPVDPNTVYVSFFARGIWRSKSNGDPGTWELIMAPLGNSSVVDTERAEFDVVKMPNGETRMFVGVGAIGGPAATGYARFRRNDAVRNAPAAAVLASWQDLTSPAQDTPGYSSYNYCEAQCWYDNYVFAPATHAPKSGADHNTVYLLGDNEYSENNWGPASPRCCPENPAPGRSNGRGVLLSTNGGEYFTDMTDDTTDDYYPVELHPDHHALVVNPRDWKQFFDLGDGGIVRSNGRFVDDSGDCVEPKGYTGTRLTFCRLMLSRVPEKLQVMNKGLRTLHFYQLNVNPHDPGNIVGGTQDNGSWERGDAPGSGTNSGPDVLPYPPAGIGQFPSAQDCLRGRNDDDDDDGDGDGDGDGEQIWVNTNIADGGHNNFDIGDPCFRQTSFQSGQLMVHYEPKNQLDANWIADTLWEDYASEGVAFIGPHNDDPVHPHWLWTGREHVFRSVNQGRNPILTKETHRANCNIWYGDFDVNDNGRYEVGIDRCDDWRPLGNPSAAGALTSPTYGADRILPPPPAAQQKHVVAVERGRDSGTLWAATNAGRIFVSKNADSPDPEAVVFDRIDNDPTASNSPPRYPTGIYVDPKNPNHAWITYSGFNAKTPTTPGHVFEVWYAFGASTFRMLDGNEPRDKMGDIPATSITRTDDGWLYVGTDYGCVKSKGDGRWTECAKGLPRMNVADLMYVRKRDKIYAATHGQGVWELDLGDDDRDD